jgi:hypothetical protein
MVPGFTGGISDYKSSNLYAEFPCFSEPSGNATVVSADLGLPDKSNEFNRNLCKQKCIESLGFCLGRCRPGSICTPLCWDQYRRCTWNCGAEVRGKPPKPPVFLRA